MAITTRLVTYAVYAICLSLLLCSGVNTQSTSPSNDTSQLQGDVGFLMSTTLNNMATSIKIVPLTNNAGLSGTADQLSAINPTGPLFLTNANTVPQLPQGDIAFISCEASDYPGQIDAPRTINFAVNNKPIAIVLFSEYSARCTFSPTGDFQYTTLYTTEDANSSMAVLQGLNAAHPPNPNTSIHVDLSTVNGTTNGGNGNVLGRSPTTAVAMIILYSITGVITALFLIIIIVGAIRAHRHPERYGPRRMVGRPRQSRAKGIARAMLETLPIVKFGDLEEENKPAEQRGDVELGPTSPERVMTTATGTTDTLADSSECSKTEERKSSGPVDTGAAADKTTEPAAETVETGAPAIDQGLACSVCVEDFEKGQDVRVLPCKHRFHPDCIDPWLLNVSGTCPLCRTDLRPTASHGEEEGDVPGPPATTSAEDAYNTAAFNESTRRNRRSRIIHTLNIGRMRNATPEERLAALRRLRNEQIAGDSTSSAGNSTPTGNRFSRRVSRAFGSRPHSGIGTPRRNSGLLPAAESSLTAATHSTTEIRSAAEDPSRTAEASATELPSMAEVPSTAQVPLAAGSSTVAELPSPTEAFQVEEAHTAEAPLAVGSANTVEVPRISAETSRSMDTPHTADAPNTTENSSTLAVPSTLGTTSSAGVLAADPAPSAASPASSSSAEASPPTEPNIAPFYSYR